MKNLGVIIGKRFLQYLWGIETLQISFKRYFSSMFLQYLWGIETQGFPPGN